MSLQGRRRPDLRFEDIHGDIEPGDYWKVIEEDGTISVRPGDGSSNSILMQKGNGQEYHGYIEHGVWS